jgi:methionyl-tRNA formyltransferase
MSKECRVFLLAYPDNPVGRVFLNTFLEQDVPVKGIIVEEKKGKKNWTRLKKKIHKDGFITAVSRMLQVYFLKLTKQNIVSLAEKQGIDVYRVNKFNSKKCSELLQTLNIDLFAIVSAPILKDYVFTKARLGCLNAHPGWLPKYRGLGGNAYAVQNGDSPGVTVHYIDEGIDTGNIIVREKLTIQPRDKIAGINDRAMARGAEIMAAVIHRIQEQKLVMPRIDESQGEMYYAMPYSAVKKLNRKLKSSEFVKNLN